ncbi:hypothetical protein I2I05_20870 [Hymenobacter sp. BT683]|uniref:Uncharacterized protein n=1 Tax=Hymenobacter jeongseonensis TaxID=2791027 RepID=A0ABS0IPM5_9BACT|nr:hypothetical protein [Hymenobacter jeongseonensis]MBF9239858.1 hypothetical protein [Hymenobacter jeongseonensis]
MNIIALVSVALLPIYNTGGEPSFQVERSRNSFFVKVDNQERRAFFIIKLEAQIENEWGEVDRDITRAFTSVPAIIPVKPAQSLRFVYPTSGSKARNFVRNTHYRFAFHYGYKIDKIDKVKYSTVFKY